MVEVFKTSILGDWVANLVVASLQAQFPSYKINVDMEDCDKILRIESDKESINAAKITEVVQGFDVAIEAL